MQRIERYGVIALVFLLVTILAVSLWGESKGDGFFSMFKSKKSTAASLDKTGEGAGDKLVRNRPLGGPVGGQAGERMLPLTTPDTLNTPVDPTALQLDPNGQPLAPGTAPTQPLQLGQGAAGQPTTPVGGNPNPYSAVRGPSAPFQPLTTPGGAIVRQDPPATAVTRDYKVRTGDTLGEIASRELGSSARWVDIQRLNKMIEPSKLQVGMTLQLPLERGASTAQVTPKGDSNNGAGKPAASTPSGSSKYVVKTGDTLGQIASRELGSSARWTEIRDLNPGLDPARLRVGTTLAMPAGVAQAKSGSREVASVTPTTTKKKSRVQ